MPCTLQVKDWPKGSKSLIKLQGEEKYMYGLVLNRVIGVHLVIPQCPDLPKSEACFSLCRYESKVDRAGKISFEIVFIRSGWYVCLF